MSKLAIIGAGAMGQAILRGLLKNNSYQSDEINVFDIDGQKLAALEQELKIKTVDSIKKIDLENGGIVLLATKPQNIDSVLEELKLDSSISIVSIAAGTKIEKFAKKFPENPIIRVMPNTPAQVGAGASVIATNDKANAEQIAQVEKIFNGLGISLILEEKDMDTVTALSGSGPAYLFYLVEAMIEAGKELGLDDEASEELSKQTVYGAAKLLLESDKSAQELRTMVTSPNGTTQAAIESLEENNFIEIVKTAIAKAKERSIELGSNQ